MNIPSYKEVREKMRDKLSHECEQGARLCYIILTELIKKNTTTEKPCVKQSMSAVQPSAEHGVGADNTRCPFGVEGCINEPVQCAKCMPLNYHAREVV